MVVRIFRSVWFLSVLAVLVALLYQYASWPEDVIVGQRDINFVMLARDNFFYLAIGLVVMVNVTVYLVKSLAKKSEPFLAWFYGFVSVINFFLIIALSFISLFNSNENFRFGQIGFIVYGSLLLIAGWLLGGIAYWLVTKNLKKTT